MQADQQKLNIIVKEVSQEAEGVIRLAFASTDGGDLPAWTPGAHIGLMIDGNLERQYSLCGKPEQRNAWEIAVLREPASRGGSEWLHTRTKVGDVLQATLPTNQFALVDAAAYIFVAGGIGITPFLPMISTLESRGTPWRLVYGGRQLSSMAFVKQLETYGDRVQVRPEDKFGLLDLKSAIGEPQIGVAVYCCGPERLLEAVESYCANWPEGALHIERFRARPGALDGAKGSFEIVLAQTQKTFTVGPDETIIDALDRGGIHVPRSCGEGTCGTCLTPVIEGIPDHRDSFLMGKKRAANNSICVCCSRSQTPRLVLDL